MCLFKSTVHLWSRIKNASINWPTMTWGAWPNWAKVLSLYSNKGLTRYLTRGTTTFNVIQINADFDGVITTKLDAMHWLGCGLISIHTSIKEIIISGGGSKRFFPVGSQFILILNCKAIITPGGRGDPQFQRGSGGVGVAPEPSPLSLFRVCFCIVVLYLHV